MREIHSPHLVRPQRRIPPSIRIFMREGGGNGGGKASMLYPILDLSIQVKVAPEESV